jgi:hypothetical protein
VLLGHIVMGDFLFAEKLSAAILLHKMMSYTILSLFLNVLCESPCMHKVLHKLCFIILGWPI